MLKEELRVKIMTVLRNAGGGFLTAEQIAQQISPSESAKRVYRCIHDLSVEYAGDVFVSHASRPGMANRYRVRML